MIEYEDDWHIYHDGMDIIPSVTQVLSPSSHFYTPGSAERGTEIHELCAEYARDSSQWPADPYIEAFALWCRARAPKWIVIDSKASPYLLEGTIDGRRFAGRPDLIAMIDGKRTVVDIKSGVKAAWHKAQVSIYAYCDKAEKALLLYLRPDISYREDWISTSEMVDGIRLFRERLKAMS